MIVFQNKRTNFKLVQIPLFQCKFMPLISVLPSKSPIIPAGLRLPTSPLPRWWLIYEISSALFMAFIVLNGPCNASGYDHSKIGQLSPKRSRFNKRA